MSIEALTRSGVRRRAARSERARVRCSCLIATITPCVACGGGAAVERSADDGASLARDPSWTEIQAVLQAKCPRCHRSPLAYGAPFPWLTHGDTRTRDSNGKARFEQMASAVDAEYMPPQFIVLAPPVALLTADERTTLLAWRSRGAPLIGSATCTGDP